MHIFCPNSAAQMFQQQHGCGRAGTDKAGQRDDEVHLVERAKGRQETLSEQPTCVGFRRAL